MTPDGSRRRPVSTCFLSLFFNTYLNVLAVVGDIDRCVAFLHQRTNALVSFLDLAYRVNSKDLFFPRLLVQDFVIGNLDDLSAGHELTTLVTSFLEEKGYKVALNNPYHGGTIVKNFGCPGSHVQAAAKLESLSKKVLRGEAAERAKELGLFEAAPEDPEVRCPSEGSLGIHSLQIEINRALYLDEASTTTNGGYGELKEDLAELSRVLARAVRDKVAMLKWRSEITS